ncbi:hypothetical protein FE782_20980 [Paenibacillus antri]|uniref:Uncharacterized protein n=1 Tax=Paenibacillus antri TaxID=2582848 RepID=A0A5R9G2U7_9BACL|nr:hypothetical protein [Paenibacillus antri]TLS50151.1 hypothetical protein FE782_20980 [Paenibacillus antri]
MSRKWERMVEKNSKRMNQDRLKKGQTPIGAKDGPEKIKGRSWVFPLVLASAGILFAFTMPQANAGDTLYQITVALYLLLALFHFFVRRPFLKVGKNELGWRTYAGDRSVAAQDIATIHIGDNRSTVMLKDGKTKRSFSKAYHLYPMNRINEALTQFAAAHHIPLNGAEKETVGA